MLYALKGPFGRALCYIVVVLVAGVTAITIDHSLSAYADERVTTFTQRAEAAGLSEAQARELQAQIDEILETQGGTQIDANKVLWEDGRGDTTIPLPGETRVRDLGIQPNHHGGPHQSCPYEYFCIYAQEDYEGRRSSFYYCQWYEDNPFRFNSWMNNQTSGTVAAFDFLGGSMYFTDPAFSFDSDIYFAGHKIYRILPCW